MSDWLNKITSLISSSDISNEVTKTPTLLNSRNKTKSTESLSIHAASPTPPKPPKTSSAEKETMMATNKDDDDENIKALKRLRELPRGTQVESRIAAIQNLLGEVEIFKTLKMLRWPQGVICPRCQSTNVIRKDPPNDSPDKRHYYVCINCKEDGESGVFDDFTGLAIESIHALRQWILCWYLIGFCSVNQIAKVLGISIQQVIQIASQGSELAELPSSDLVQAHGLSEKARDANRRRRDTIEDQEERTRSASKSPFKPGYKSKK